MNNPFVFIHAWMLGAAINAVMSKQTPEGTASCFCGGLSLSKNTIRFLRSKRKEGYRVKSYYLNKIK